MSVGDGCGERERERGGERENKLADAKKWKDRFVFGFFTPHGALGINIDDSITLQRSAPK
jgi:hypothetical protein